MGEMIELAHEPAFSIGRVTVHPAQRELVRDDGHRDILEHKVMQALIALARSDGAIVTRSELVARCWQGRIVGDDAINRVMSRLRRAAEGIGAGSFGVETVSKVGYRLVLPAATDDAPPAENAPPQAEATPVPALSRRNLVIGAGALAIAGVAGALGLRARRNETSPVLEALFAQAWTAWTLWTPDGFSQALGLYRRAIEIDPNSARAWGYLGCLYGDMGHSGPAAERPALYERARDAGHRALALDRDDVLGPIAIVYAQPYRGNWLAMERTIRAAMAKDAQEPLPPFALAFLLSRVGRLSESAALLARLDKNPPTAAQFKYHIEDLWSIGRHDEAERMLATAMSIFARTTIWYTKFDMLLDAGRYSAAEAFARDPTGRPTSMTDDRADLFAAIAAAANSRDANKIDAIATKLVNEARDEAPWRIGYICHLGRTDDAFALTEAWLLSRGRVIPDRHGDAGQSPVASLGERDTRFLFQPLARPMRGDRRFPGLMKDVGLADYWREAGALPDYLRT